MTKPIKSPLGRCYVPVKTEQEWKSLMEACEAYNKRTGYNFMWTVDSEPTKEYARSGESYIYFGDTKYCDYPENKICWDKKTDKNETMKKLSYQEAMKRLGATETKKERWKPKDGEKYWTLYRDFEICFSTFRTGEYHNKYYEIGNCFRTRREAQAAAKKVKELLKSL
jgi:hypothetical protein